MELKRLKRDYEAQKAENERLRTEGKLDRAEIGRRTREANKIRQQAEDLEDTLQAKLRCAHLNACVCVTDTRARRYDEIANAPTNRDDEIAKVERDFGERISEKRAMMRLEPLGQDRHWRTFWLFDRHREADDVVLVHDTSDQTWSVIEDAERLRALRNTLESRGVREKQLRLRLSEVIPEIEARVADEAERWATPKMRQYCRDRCVSGRCGGIDVGG